MSHEDIVVLIPEVMPKGNSGFQLPTIWAGSGCLLMDRILPQVRYLRWLKMRG